MATTQRRSWVLWILGAFLTALLILPHYAGATGGQSTDVASKLQQLKAALADAKSNQGTLQKALDGANAALDQAENELAAANFEQLAAAAQAKQANRLMRSSQVQIGRASCRESVDLGGRRIIKKKKKNKNTRKIQKKGEKEKKAKKKKNNNTKH